MGAVTRAPLPHPAALWRRLAAEFLGSAFLAAIVIGSGIAAQRLSPSDTGLELLENSAATADGPLRDHPDVRAGVRRALPGRLVRRRRARRPVLADAAADRPPRSRAASPGRWQPT